MIIYDNPMTERAVLDHLSRHTPHGGATQMPCTMRSERHGNFVVLANLDGRLAYYRVRRHQNGSKYVRLLK